MNKAVLLSLIACFVAVQANFFLPKFNPVVSDAGLELPTWTGSKKNLKDYYDGIWGFFNLQQNDASNCFDDTTAPAYFQWIQAGYNLTQAFTQGNHAAASAYFATYTALNQSLQLTFQCLDNSKDYLELMDTLGVNTFNKTNYELRTQLYWAAHSNDWYVDFTPINQLMASGNFSGAGTVYGPVVQAMVGNTTRFNMFFEGLKGFHNGIFFAYNLTSPFNISTCYNDTMAFLGIRFYYGWSQSVANTTAANASNATMAWFNGEGGQLANQTASVDQCEETTQDLQRLNKAVGYDIHGSQFGQAMMKYINNPSNSFRYWFTFNRMYDCWTNYDALCAGMTMADFYSEVAASIGDIEL